MKKTINIFWFRRDLRIEDNCGFYHALTSRNPVLPIFIFDTDILNKLENKKDKRVEFIYKEIENLKSVFEKYNSSLFTFIGKPIEAFKDLNNKYIIEKVFTNNDYEPYGIIRDKTINDYLQSINIKLISFKDIVIHEKNDVLKDDETPYTVYTPYSKKWHSKLNEVSLQEYPSENKLSNLVKTEAIRFPSIEEIGFSNNNSTFPPKDINIELIKNYEQNRDIPASNGTSKLSIHLRFGTISIRKLLRMALKHSRKYTNELIWREFYQMILYHFPHIVDSAFKKEYNFIKWNNNEEAYYAWCEGKTGFPLVDAGMRELKETGYMHNRVRMVVASFLTKDLFIDWKWGEQYFAQHLLDYDMASNIGGWQWAAGCGVDAAPYFRIFNPEIQAKKFDPNFIYIKKWIEEYGTDKYPKPIVDHYFQSKQTIIKYKQALI